MRTLAAVLLAATLLHPAPVSAQLGGIKKRVTDRVAGRTDTTKAKPACDASGLVITADVVDRYIKSFTARDAELTRVAREPGETGQYWTAWLKRRDIERRKREYDLHRGPDYQKLRALQARFMGGDASAQREQQALVEELNPNRIELPDLGWETQQQGNQRADKAQREAGGFSECDWTNGIVERLPRMTYSLLDGSADGERLALETGTKAEVAALKARIPDLARVMELSYQTEAERRQIAKEDSLANQRMLESQLGPERSCAVRASNEFMARHKAEFDQANEKGDTAALTRLSLLMAQEQQKCYQ
jgi:hypothetical protein